VQDEPDVVDEAAGFSVRWQLQDRVLGLSHQCFCFGEGGEGCVVGQGGANLQIARRGRQPIEVAAFKCLLQREHDPALGLLAGPAGAADCVEQLRGRHSLTGILAVVLSRRYDDGSDWEVHAVGEGARSDDGPNRLAADSVLDGFLHLDGQAGVVVRHALADASDQGMVGAESGGECVG
jgi:hypothetical protein